MSKFSIKKTALALKSDRSGATAIEFGILGPIFLALVCGIMFFGVFMFNGKRLDAAAFDAARQAMLVNEPTLTTVKAEVDETFRKLNLDGATVRVAIGTRPDGGEEAIITAKYVMLDPTSLLNTQGFTRNVEYRVPLWEN